MNLSTIRTQDAVTLIEKTKTANINDIKTTIVQNYTKKGQASLTRYQIAVNELHSRGIMFHYTENCFNFVAK